MNELDLINSPAMQEALQKAVLAERLRITGLLAMDQRQFGKEIRAAIEKGWSLEATSVEILRVISDRGITLDAIERDGQAAVYAPAPDGAPSKPAPRAGEAIFRARAKIVAALKGATS